MKQSSSDAGDCFVVAPLLLAMTELCYHCPAMDTFKTKLPKLFDLPKRIERLGELAYNLWWTWQPEAARLFGKLDYDMWERLGHNPIRLLREIGRTRLNQAVKDKDYLALYDEVFANFDSYFSDSKTWMHRTHPEFDSRPIAYFSMEFGLHVDPIYY